MVCAGVIIAVIVLSLIAIYLIVLAITNQVGKKHGRHYDIFFTRDKKKEDETKVNGTVFPNRSV